jgi:hypothetical protein
LIPDGPAAGKRFDAFMSEDSSRYLHLAADIKLPAATFGRAGTQAMTRIVVIDKTANADLVGGRGVAEIDLSDAADIKALFDRIEDLSVPERPTAAESPAYETVRAVREEREADDSRFTTAEFNHTRTGEPVFAATLKQRSDDFKELSAAAKRNGGYYSGYKGGGAVPGFLFKTEEARSAFLEDVEGGVDMMSNFEQSRSSVQNLVDSVYDANGDLDYERIQDTVTAIYEGEVGIERLSRQGEQGRLDGGGLCVGASLIVGASTRTSSEGGARKRRNKEEESLEAYARSQGAWIDDVDTFKAGLNKFAKDGAEAEVFKSGDSVIKVVPIPEMDSADSSILRFFDDKIALHNTLPNVAPYELVGFARDLNAHLTSPDRTLMGMHLGGRYVNF